MRLRQLAILTAAAVAFAAGCTEEGTNSGATRTDIDNLQRDIAAGKVANEAIPEISRLIGEQKNQHSVDCAVTGTGNPTTFKCLGRGEPGRWWIVSCGDFGYCEITEDYEFYGSSPTWTRLTGVPEPLASDCPALHVFDAAEARCVPMQE